MTTKRERARAMSPDERRAALVEATLPLLVQHGRAVTTRQIAEAAGVAEGTIFRVFDSKEELVDAALARAFEPGRLVHEIAELDADAPLRERMLGLVTLLQRRFTDIFGLMNAVGMVGPPEHHHREEERNVWRARVNALLVELVGDDADLLTVAPTQFVHVIRLLTFAGSHPHISDGQILTPQEIVDTILFGTLKERP